MKELLGQLDIIDKSLFVVLIVSLFFKLLREIGIFFVECFLIKKRDVNKKCVFLEEVDGKYQCRVDFLRKKFCINRCDKKHCWGFKTSEINERDFISGQLVFRLINISVNLATELSSAILIIKNIF